MNSSDDTARELIEALAEHNRAAAAELEQMLESKTTFADLEAMTKEQSKFYAEFYQSLREAKDEEK